jgi:prepilin-type N-terminal cleavage/methylation domain-containing protein
MTEPTRKNHRGVTLIELMIVLLIAGLVVGGIYTLFSTQQRSYYVQDRVAGIQQDARAAMTIMSRDIRMSGLLTASDGFTVNTFQFAVNPVNNSGPNGQDSITVVLAAEEAISSTTGDPITVTTINNQQVTLSDDVPSDFFDIDPDPQSFVAFEGENHVYKIGSIEDDNKLNLTEYPPSYLEDVKARVFRVKAITYTVTDPDGNPGLGVLRRNENTGNGAQPLVGDGTTTFVEDLQFAYQVQGDGTWYDNPTNPADIEMVRINITVRTAVQDATVQDTGVSAAQFNQPPLEDHTTGLSGPDGFRRRVYTTVVKARNL